MVTQSYSPGNLQKYCDSRAECKKRSVDLHISVIQQ